MAADPSVSAELQRWITAHADAIDAGEYSRIELHFGSGNVDVVPTLRRERIPIPSRCGEGVQSEA